MYPVICQIGFLSVYSYGVALAVAVLICTFLAQGEAKKSGVNPDLIIDLAFWVIVSGLIGCRLFFIFLNLSYFIENPSEIFMIHRGGLAWQGGLILGLITCIFFLKRHKLPVLKTLDMIIPYVALGQAIGRIGCFLNGCCYGKEVGWGIFFPVHQAILHPTQLYSSFGLLTIFVVLRLCKKRKMFDGQIFILYLVLASVLRYFVEFLRADHEKLFFGLSIFQVVTFFIVLAAVYANTLIKSRSRK